MKTRFRRLVLALALVICPTMALAIGGGTAGATSVGCWSNGGGNSTDASCTHLDVEGGGGDWFRAGSGCYNASIGFVTFYGPYRNYANVQSHVTCPTNMTRTSSFNQHS